MATKKVPRPTIGRVVLVRLSERMIRPAIVYDVNGQTLSAQVQGPAPDMPESLEARSYDPRKNVVGPVIYGEADDGIPAFDRWCWPPMSREEVEVEDLLADDE